jgi:phosphoribosylaminoimidazolecarboxamide formyltransferase / IMP cyclohydrolase
MTSHRIRRALLSVSDKTGLPDFAARLHALGVELISTGGTANALRAAGLPVRDVSSLTDFPEILDGRVKTLHPRIHAGLLARRDLETHLAQLREHNLETIDLAVVNLYPFSQTVENPHVVFDEAIENIDIGGPSMIRAAAKNFHHAAPVVDPADYAAVADELEANGGALSLATRYRLARTAFERTAAYDAAIADFLLNRTRLDAETSEFGVSAAEAFPPRVTLTLARRQSLRYGENPHQLAALYAAPDGGSGVATAEQAQGKELSFNNFLDLDAAWALVREFDHAACAIIKHTNPCGVGVAAVPLEALRLALETDPVSAFGGIFAFNVKVDAGTATEISSMFVEAVIAPDYDDAALRVFSAKKNVRVMRMPNLQAAPSVNVRSVSGGFLLQSADTHRVQAEGLTVVTERAPSPEETRDLLFAWTICKHVKSNAITYAKNGQLIGVGAGQMSRVDSVKLGATKARLPLAGSVLASDAFFPFRDGVDEAAKHGVTAIIQPGGSVRDEEVIAAANAHGLAMVLTGVRHFKH